jgi:hypothetical protein
MWNFVDLHGVHATVRFASEPIAFSPQAIANRKVAAVEAQAAVVALSDVPVNAYPRTSPAEQMA